MFNNNIKIESNAIEIDLHTLILANQELIEALDFIMSDPHEVVSKYHEQEYPIIFSASQLIKVIKSKNSHLLELTSK